NRIEDKQYEDIVISMRQELKDWFYQYVDPKIDGAHEGVTGMGQLRRAGIYAEGKPVYPQRSKNVVEK
ncbi:MAG: sulfatase, partial [Epulopiscium sp.]|nr:sulfatase [Candidatus Epulonipiscium sp.]